MPQTMYYELVGFDTVYLEDSYVLNVHETPTSIEFEMSAVLTEDHPDYEPPPPGIQYCYRNAKIRFSDAQQIEWIEKDFKPITDADGTVDYGNIDAFYLEDGRYHLEGDWGQLTLISAPPSIESGPVNQTN